MKKIAETWRTRSTAARILFIISIVYAISSLNVLFLAHGIVNSIPGLMFDSKVMMTYSIISFLYGLALSIYHLYTFLARRKRIGDKGLLSGEEIEA